MFSEEQENFILDRKLERYTTKEIADALNCEESEVIYFLKWYNIIRPPLKKPAILENISHMPFARQALEIGDWLYNHWLEGYEVPYLSEVTGIPKSKVFEIVEYRKEKYKWNNKPVYAPKELRFTDEESIV